MDNSKSFFKVWRNVVTKERILYHTRLYNLHRHIKVIDDMSEEVQPIRSYPYKHYIQSVSLMLHDKTLVLPIVNDLLISTDGDCKFSIFLENDESDDEESDDEEDENKNENENENENENKNENENENHNKDETFHNKEISKKIIKASKNFKDFVKAFLSTKGLEVKIDETLPLIKINKMNIPDTIKIKTIPPNLFPNETNTFLISFGYKKVLNNLPKQLKHLSLFKDFTLDTKSLPNGLERIEFYDQPKFEFKKGILPQSIREISFSNVNQLISSDWLPQNLESITFLQPCQLDENSLLPLKNLKTIAFSSSFSNKLFDVDKRIKIIPDSVTDLTIEFGFDSLFPGCLPSELLVLKTYPIRGRRVTTNENNDKKTIIESDVLPKKLVSFTMGLDQYFKSTDSIPPSLIKIHGINSLEQLKLLPTSVVNISLSFQIPNFKVGDIPSHIEKLKISKKDGILEKGILTDCLSLKCLDLLSDIKSIDIESLPSKLERLTISFSKDKESFSPHSLPESLKVLILRNKLYPTNFFESPFKNLVALQIIPSLSSETFQLASLPQSLMVLDIFTQNSIKCSELPKSIKYLVVRGNKALLLPLSPSLQSIFVHFSFLYLNNEHEILETLKTLDHDQMKKIFKKLIKSL
ncbi:hypothetical protein ACTFIV_005668 [Dictyostelium citrinum]